MCKIYYPLLGHIYKLDLFTQPPMPCINALLNVAVSVSIYLLTSNALYTTMLYYS